MMPGDAIPPTRCHIPTLTAFDSSKRKEVVAPLDSVDDGPPVSIIMASSATTKSDVVLPSSEIPLLPDAYDGKIRISNKTASMTSQQLATSALLHNHILRFSLRQGFGFHFFMILWMEAHVSVPEMGSRGGFGVH